MNHLIPILLIACTQPPTDTGDPQPDTAPPEPIPISILGHCPDWATGTAPPAVTITGHDECVLVWLTTTRDEWVYELEVCGGYGEWTLGPGFDYGVTWADCDLFLDWGQGNYRIAVSMEVDGVCYGSGEAEWCPDW